MTNTPHQVALPLRLSDPGDFSTFVPGPNESAIRTLRCAVSSGMNEFFLVSGPVGCGKSHLMGALSRTMRYPGECFVIDLRLAKDFSPQFLNIDLPKVTLIDNVDAIAGDSAWELEVFTLFNRWYDRHSGTMVMTSVPSFDKIPFARSDLNTRLGSGVSLNLLPLDEESCVKALLLRARGRGFALPVQTASFMVRHCNRDMRTLVSLLDRLDEAQLEERHELTVPFVKKILAIG